LKVAKTTDVTKDNGQLPIVQITFLDRPAVDAAVAEQYGVHSSPKVGTPCLLLEINGDCSNRIIIPLSAFNRTKGLEETEVEFGNFEIGSIIKFDKEGNITITGKKNLTANIVGDTTITSPNVTINGDVQVNGTIDATGIITSDVDVISDTISGKTHTHPQGNDSGTNTEQDTGAPL